MNSSKIDRSAPANQDPPNNLEDVSESPIESSIQPELKPTMSKREIMEELSRQRFPWEE